MPYLYYCVPFRWLCEQTERIPRCTGRKPFLSSIWRSSFGFSLWASFWPLLGIKFQYFMIHGILCFFSPQQFTGLSWGNCQVWRFWKCLEGFYFTAERQFDGLVQKELRFTQLHCLFWLHFFVMPEAKAGCTVNLIQTFCCPPLFKPQQHLYPVPVQDPTVQPIKAHPFLGVLSSFCGHPAIKGVQNLATCFTH